MFYTYMYYHGCHGNIFFLQFFVKNSSNQAQFCLLFLKQELKKKNQEC
jgi:hypothetical protein